MITIIKRLVFLSISSVLLFNSAIAQDFAYNNITPDELKMTVYDRDSSAHAVVLNEHGDASLTFRNTIGVRLVYNYHVKIKILDNDGFAKGTVQIPLYSNNDKGEEISDINGVTVYRDESGRPKSEEFTPSQIFRVAQNANYTIVKLAMPGLRKGCVIEYKYTVTTPYFENFHEWTFQSDMPKLKSVYEVHIPAFWSFNAVKIGALKLDRNESVVEKDCMMINTAKADCSHFTYGMNNIPAFVIEDYMTAPRNFIAAIRFELYEFSDPFTGARTKIAKDWKDVDQILKHNDYFGLPLRRKGLLKDAVTPLIGNETDSLAKAKKIYAFIQKNIKWNGDNNFGTSGIKQALDKHTGDAGDINLSLLSALWAAGIDAEPVLISTRGHGVINKLYPVITEFNYVIVKADLGGKTYLLDATDPLLSFGMLPMHCLNDQGRVMPLDKPSYWIDIKEPNIQSSTVILNLTLGTNGKLTGTITNYSRGYEAFLKRKAIKKFNSIDEYVEDLGNRWNRIKIKKAEVLNVDSLDKAISEVYDVEMDAYNNMNNQKLAFNPFLINRIVTNPFKLKERSYSVDWGMPSESKFMLNLQLPEGYTIESPPKNEGFALPDNGGTFIVNYAENGNSFSLSHVTQFKKSVYFSDEYPYLKELYARMISSEKTEMIFKKKI
ncbi:DUF3857 domain-containing protein [Mucilaginibacter panaciglaebae]|uniref:Transglutaminase superfamily protein n=1 Tax=Mucilaginibacter panaciglaebae TaxID=502331 RepID=A0ABP7WAI7_9SPHI